ncbi:hypothetical protein AAMO2058_001493900 [Amorphochlora amoebiformis]
MKVDSLQYLDLSLRASMETLKNTHHELKEKQKRIERETEDISRKLKEESKAQQTLSLELNNDYAKNTKKFEDSMTICQYSENPEQKNSNEIAV